MVDDTIREHLNEIKSVDECDEYFQKHIVAQWKVRDNAIEFCGDVSRRLRDETQQARAEDWPAPTGNTDFDLRLDPYALKDYNDRLERQFEKCQYIDNWVSNERSVESIVREQTTEVLNNKCRYRNWLEDFRKVSSK